MKFTCKVINGQVIPQNTEKLRAYSLKKPHIRYSLEPLVSESRNMRGFYHSAILSLWAYLDGADYKDSKVIEDYHEVARQEFSFDVVFANKKAYKIGRTTKGQLMEHIEKCIEYLEENYAIDRIKLLDAELYKEYRDEVRADFGAPETFIEYMKVLKLLK